MSQSNWSNFRKDKLRKLLEAEGISTSSEQTKEELVRLFDLAKSASKPSRKAPVRRKKIKFQFRPITLVFLFLALLIGVSSFYLYQNNVTFQTNINNILNITPKSKILNTSKEPQIYERSGKTYVVYNHPLVKVVAIEDSRCLRPECLFDSHLDRVKSNITPLINMNRIDYLDRSAKNLIAEYDLKLLPVFIFDKTIEQTLHFDKIKKFFDFKNGKYILSTDQAYKTLVNPKLSDAVFFTSNKFLARPLEIIMYGNFTSPFAKDMVNNLDQLIQKNPDRQTVVFKHFTSSEKDFKLAVGFNCMLQQGSDPLSTYKLMTNDMEGVLADSEKQLLRRMQNLTRKLGVNRSTFNSCFDEDTTVKQTVRNHLQEANTLGITAVPTLLINRNIVQGSPNLEDLELLISEIAKNEGVDLNSNPESSEI